MTLVWAIAWVSLAFAADPGLEFVYPAGGRVDSEFEIEVGGAGVQAATQAVFSGEGVKAAFLGTVQTVTYNKKGRPIPEVMLDRCRFKVIVAKDAAPGIRSLRVGTVYGLSEPVSFEISSLPEMSQPATNRAANRTTLVAEMPVCLNGRLHGTGQDRYRFQATAGMRLVAFTEAQVLSGEFLPSLTFLDAAGKPCEGVTACEASAAPILVFDVPQDGAYALKIRGAGQTGDDASVYRVKLGELPLVTGFSPPGAKEGESLNVQLSGHNLPQKRMRLFTGGKNSALCMEALTEDALVVPGVQFGLWEEPETDEHEPTDTPADAQPIEIPCVVSGVLGPADARDVFRFNGVAGETVWVDVYATVLGSSLKPMLTVRNQRGETVVRGAYNTAGTELAALQVRDPSVAVKLDEEGPYDVEVTDAEGRSGEAFFYRLRVGPPRPDFRVWMTPSSLNIPPDGSALVEVHLQRLHGFEDEVRITLDFPPLSIACEGGVIPTGETSCLMTVSTDGARFPRTVFGLSLTATAEIGGRQVKHAAVPVRFFQRNGRAEAHLFGELSAKAASYLPALHLLVAPGKPVLVSGAEPVRLTVLSATLAVQFGGDVVPVVVWPPKGFSVQGVQRTNRQEKASVLLTKDPACLPAGQKGQLILGCYRKKDTRKTVMAVTQSVPFVVE